LIRVTRPGGYVGLNECYWIRQPPAEILAQSVYIGSAIIPEAEWWAIWEAMPLEARSIEAFALTTKNEVQDRIGWVGWRSILPAWGRLIRLLLSNPRSRDAIRHQLGSPAEMITTLGYGLFVGRKP